MSLWRVVQVAWKVHIKTNLFLNSGPFITKMPFYAVAKGRTKGIFMTWPDCEAQVKGYSGAKYKKFDSEVSAQDFINSFNEGDTSAKSKQSKGDSKSVASSSTNLKRNFSTASNSQKTDSNSQKTDSDSQKTSSNSQKKSVSRKPKRKTFAIPGYEEEKDDSHDYNSDDSDDLNTILSKQMDDIELRLKTFEKGIDEIIKKAPKKTILIEPPQNKRRKTSGGNGEFETDSDGYVQVYTDGACSSNGKSGARAGLGVYWGDGHPLNISEPVSGRATNNCGEIQAATQAIKVAHQNGVKKLSINTDSKFLINSVTKWMPGWKRKGWKLASGEPVKNEKDFKDLDSVQHKLQIKWNYVEAHRGIHGNEMADQLAKAGATMYNK